MCGTRWCGHLGAHPGWNVITPCGYTFGGGAGAAFGVVSGVCTLVGGVTSGGRTLVKIYGSCLSASVCFSPHVVSGLVGVRLKRAWVRSAAACVVKSCEDSIDKVSVAGGKSVVSETLYFSVLGM